MAMGQFQLFDLEPDIFSVSEITKLIRELLESDENLQELWVKGEVSNKSIPKSGHMYFTLKDRDASLRCVMWRQNVSRLEYNPRDGDEVEIHGGIGLYEISGQYQLYVDNIRPVGEGELFKEFLRIKSKLEKEGLFDADRKHPIPDLPRRIGIITSPTGAALRDILNTLRRRFPLAEVILSPAAVQGDAAPAEILGALKALEKYADPDVIILGRGGGSIEDLWAFNDESVAREVANSQVPVISGVGHETDFTIVDFVSDLRAPTPTAAAELAVPDQSELLDNLADLQRSLLQFTEDMLLEKKQYLNILSGRVNQLTPMNKIRSDLQTLDDLAQRANLTMDHSIKLLSARLAGSNQQLQALSPKNVLGRGYAVVTDKSGQVVKRTNMVKPGDNINIEIQDGEFQAEITESE